MYCLPAWHDNHSGHHSLDTMKRAWEEIFSQSHHHDLKYKISFTGGELTTNKSFLPFVAWLRTTYKDHIFKLLATTNGSASYRYYVKMFDCIDNITFSVHSEHIDESAFFDKMIKLKHSINADKFLHVAVMDEFWNRDRIPLYVKILEQNKISYSVNEINYAFQTRTFPIMKGNLNLAL
jgi:hypothetical protein